MVWVCGAGAVTGADAAPRGTPPAPPAATPAAALGATVIAAIEGGTPAVFPTAAGAVARPDAPIAPASTTAPAATGPAIEVPFHRVGMHARPCGACCAICGTGADDAALLLARCSWSRSTVATDPAIEVLFRRAGMHPRPCRVCCSVCCAGAAAAAWFLASCPWSCSTNDKVAAPAVAAFAAAAAGQAFCCCCCPFGSCVCSAAAAAAASPCPCADSAPICLPKNSWNARIIGSIALCCASPTTACAAAAHRPHALVIQRDESVREDLAGVRAGTVPRLPVLGLALAAALLFHLAADLRRPLPQRLGRLLGRLPVADVVPASLPLVALEEPPAVGVDLRPYRVDDALGHEALPTLGQRDVQALVRRDEGPPVVVPRVVVRPPPPSAEDVDGGGLEDIFGRGDAVGEGEVGGVDVPDGLGLGLFRLDRDHRRETRPSSGPGADVAPHLLPLRAGGRTEEPGLGCWAPTWVGCRVSPKRDGRVAEHGGAGEDEGGSRVDEAMPGPATMRQGGAGGRPEDNIPLGTTEVRR
ncbi:hypothetical protein ACHAWF_014386 [Thalassiosira exigua]